MVDYVRDPTPHDNFGGGSATWVVWAHALLVKSLSFFSFFLLKNKLVNHRWRTVDRYAIA